MNQNEDRRLDGMSAEDVIKKAKDTLAQQEDTDGPLLNILSEHIFTKSAASNDVDNAKQAIETLASKRAEEAAE